MATIGEVNIIPMEKSHHVEWKILNFTSFMTENEKYFSPSFSFAGECWNLMIHPNGYKATNSIGYIFIYLERKSSAPSSVVLEYSLGLKTLNGEKNLKWYCNTFNNINQAWGIRKFFLRSDLLKREDIFSPTDSLTVFCFMKYPKAAVNASKS